jgi:hypothetical protein
MTTFIEKFRKAIIQLIPLLFAFLSSGLLYAQSGKKNEWTDTQYPSYIKRMNYSGERAD